LTTAALTLLRVQTRILAWPFLLVAAGWVLAYLVPLEIVRAAVGTLLAVAAGLAGPLIFGTEYQEGHRDYLATRPSSPFLTFWYKVLVLSCLVALSALGLDFILSSQGYLGFAVMESHSFRITAAILFDLAFWCSAVTIATRDMVRGILYGTPTIAAILLLGPSLLKKLFEATVMNASTGLAVPVFPFFDGMLVASLVVVSPLPVLGLLAWVHKIQRWKCLCFPWLLLTFMIPFAALLTYNVAVSRTEGTTEVTAGNPGTTNLAHTVIGGKEFIVQDILKRKILSSLDLKEGDTFSHPLILTDATSEPSFERLRWATFLDNRLILCGDHKLKVFDLTTNASQTIEIPLDDYQYPIGCARLRDGRLGICVSSSLVQVLDPLTGQVEKHPELLGQYWDRLSGPEFDSRLLFLEASIPFSKQTPTKIVSMWFDPGKDRFEWMTYSKEDGHTYGPFLLEGLPLFIWEESNQRLVCLGKGTSWLAVDFEGGEPLSPITHDLPSLPERFFHTEERVYCLRHQNPGNYDFVEGRDGPELQLVPVDPSLPLSEDCIVAVTSNPSNVSSPSPTLPAMISMVVDGFLLAGFSERDSSACEIGHYRRSEFRAIRGPESRIHIYDTTNLDDPVLTEIEIPWRISVLSKAYYAQGGLWKRITGLCLDKSTTTTIPCITMGGGFLLLWVPDICRVAAWDIQDPAKPVFLGVSAMEEHLLEVGWILEDGSPPWPSRFQRSTTPLRRGDGALGFLFGGGGYIWLKFPQLAKGEGA